MSQYESDRAYAQAVVLTIIIESGGSLRSDELFSQLITVNMNYLNPHDPPFVDTMEVIESLEACGIIEELPDDWTVTAANKTTIELKRCVENLNGSHQKI